MKLDHHTIVLLVRPPDAPELTDQEAAELQDAHLANQARLGDEGYVIAAGPFVDQDDERLRGIAVLSVDPETARRLYETDPAVQRGRLAVRGDDLDGAGWQRALREGAAAAVDGRGRK